MPGRPAGDAAVIPTRKISETIIDFGEPVIGQLDPDQPLVVVRAAFNVVILVWNAHVMAMPVWNTPSFLAQLEAMLRTPAASPEFIQAYQALTARRRSQFAGDPRAVGEWSISIERTGRVTLRCDARIPPSLTSRKP